VPNNAQGIIGFAVSIVAIVTRKGCNTWGSDQADAETQYMLIYLMREFLLVIAEMVASRERF
jgi:hypothetical protein